MSQGGSKTSLTFTWPTPATDGDGILHPARHVAGHRAARRRQRHVHLDIAVVVDIEPIDQAELVDIDGDLGIEDGLQRGDQIVLQPLELVRRNGGSRALPAAGRADAGLDLGRLVSRSLGPGSRPRPSF